MIALTAFIAMIFAGSNAKPKTWRQKLLLRLRAQHAQQRLLSLLLL
jgi:hypothetical protein